MKEPRPTHYVEYGQKKPFVHIAVFLLLVLGLLWLLFGGRGYKATVKQYVDATMDGNARKIVSLMPADYVRTAVEYGEYRNKADIIDDLQMVLNQTNNTYDEYFGNRWKCEYRIEDTYRYSRDEKDLYFYYNDYAGIEDSVLKIMEVTYSFEVSGDGNHSGSTETLLLYRIGRKWYIGDTLY